MIVWTGIAELAYDAWREKADQLGHEQHPPWAELAPWQKAAWVEATRMACDVFARAVTA